MPVHWGNEEEEEFHSATGLIVVLVGHHKTPPVTYSARNVSVMNSPGSLELERLSFAKKHVHVCVLAHHGELCRTLDEEEEESLPWGL